MNSKDLEINPLSSALPQEHYHFAGKQGLGNKFSFKILPIFPIYQFKLFMNLPSNLRPSNRIAPHPNPQPPRNSWLLV